jgi:hypothetical protein
MPAIIAPIGTVRVITPYGQIHFDRVTGEAEATDAQANHILANPRLRLAVEDRPARVSATNLGDGTAIVLSSSQLREQAHAALQAAEAAEAREKADAAASEAKDQQRQAQANAQQANALLAQQQAAAAMDASGHANPPGTLDPASVAAASDGATPDTKTSKK